MTLRTVRAALACLVIGLMATGCAPQFAPESVDSGQLSYGVGGALPSSQLSGISLEFTRDSYTLRLSSWDDEHVETGVPQDLDGALDILREADLATSTPDPDSCMDCPSGTVDLTAGDQTRTYYLEYNTYSRVLDAMDLVTGTDVAELGNELFPRPTT